MKTIIFLGELANNMSFMGKINRAVILKNPTNLFGTDGIAFIDLWDLRINSFRNQVNSVTTSNIHHHHHHVPPPARIALNLSRHFSLSFIASGRSSGLHPVSSHSYSHKKIQNWIKNKVYGSFFFSEILGTCTNAKVKFQIK